MCVCVRVLSCLASTALTGWPVKRASAVAGKNKKRSTLAVYVSEYVRASNFQFAPTPPAAWSNEKA